MATGVSPIAPGTAIAQEVWEGKLFPDQPRPVLQRGVIEVVELATGQTLATVAKATGEDVHAAA